MKNVNKLRLQVVIMSMVAALFLAPARCPAGADEAKLPVDNVKDLQHYITSENPYTDWQLWPGKEKLYEGSQPHGAFLTTYVNNIAMEALQAGKKEFPQGTILVKENYNRDKKLAAVTVMYRVQGYNPAAGDWYWLKYLPDGKVAAEGKVASCIDCHKRFKSDDWVFTERP
jgi:hypothetical protein